jgi:hypothetical protein
MYHNLTDNTASDTNVVAALNLLKIYLAESLVSIQQVLAMRQVPNINFYYLVSAFTLMYIDPHSITASAFQSPHIQPW